MGNVSHLYKRPGWALDNLLKVQILRVFLYPYCAWIYCGGSTGITTKAGNLCAELFCKDFGDTVSQFGQMSNE